MTVATTLAGKVALVTGSTSGIGLSMIRALAAAGADVALHGFGDHATISKIQVSARRCAAQEERHALHAALCRARPAATLPLLLTGVCGHAEPRSGRNAAPRCTAQPPLPAALLSPCPSASPFLDPAGLPAI
jgi:NAD(P)-dependent dehydrogenase (short-subunit alcohol dehydrogenase family)